MVDIYMKLLLAKLFVFIALVSLVYLGLLLLLATRYPGYIQSYSCVVTDHRGSAIFGSSRSLTGIEPAVLNKTLGAYLPFFNYSGNIYATPYGPVYHSFIQRKTRDWEFRDNRLFVLNVDPWTVSCEKKKDAANFFNERHSFYHRLRDVKSGFNAEFLIFYADRPLKSILTELIFRSSGGINEGGRFVYPISREECVQGFTKRFALAQQRHRNHRYYINGQLSKIRLLYLHRTLQYLSGIGRVILVRMPLTREMLAMENEMDALFSLRMKALSAAEGVAFIDYSREQDTYLFVDDNHLYNTSAEAFTAKLAKDVRNYLKAQDVNTLNK